ncbi:MAG TPA: peptidylprolyl isomerase [Streptosporangiaceae bacterium]|nr:peptidylprolyl isomerase [Streptosporangiaceae bacterium]
MAGKKERQRRLARERHERRLAREAQRQQQVRKITRWTAASVVLLVIAGAVVAVVIELGSSGKSTAAQTTSSPSIAATSPAASPTPTASPSPAGPVTDCIYAKSPAPAKPLPGSRSFGLPPAKPDYKATYRATIQTNRGSIVMDLLNSKATCTVNSFVFLADKGYFNKTHCHRLTTSGFYVLQCGDPTGTGKGGPGYEFNSENLVGATYPAGIVAMANTGQPGSNGSQFFLVYKNTSLPPSYTPFGTIVSGLNIIQMVAKAGTDNSNGPGDGHPKEKVVIESVTIKKT